MTAIDLPVPLNPVLSKTLLLMGRTAITVLVAGYVYHRLDWRSLHEVAVTLNPLLLLAATCLHGCGIALAAVRWRSLLGSAGIQLTWAQTFRIGMIGLYFNLFYLGSTGGDVARFVTVLPNSPKNKLPAAISLLQDRVTGIGALLSLLAGLIAVEYHHLRTDIALHTFATAAVGASLVYWLVVAALWRLTPDLAEEAPDSQGWRHKAVGALRCLLPKSVFRQVIGLSFAIHVLTILAGFLAAKAVGLGISLTATGVVLGLTALALSLPITIAGLGVRDGMIIWLIGIWGSGTAAQAAGLAACLLGISLAWSLAGGIALIWPQPKSAVPSAETHA